MIHARTASLLAATAVFLAGGHSLWAGPILDPTAPNTLVLFTLGSVPGIAEQYGNDISYEGIAITTNNLLLAVGNAAGAVQTIWSMPVIRNNGHISGFGPIQSYASVMSGPVDSFGLTVAGGLLVTGSGVLYTTQPADQSSLGVYTSANGGSSTLTNLASIGAESGGLQYVPNGFDGAGRLKLSSTTGTWFDANLSGNPGTYTQYNPGVGAYSFDYVPVDATFLTPRIVLGDSNAQRLDAYAIDSNGNPCPGCSPVVHLVTSDLGIGYGVARDPVTGDILFTTQSNDIWVVSDSIPEPGTVGLGLGGLALLWWARRRSRSRGFLCELPKIGPI